LIPFSTFFGATFLGKAVVKSTIQVLTQPHAKVDSPLTAKSPPTLFFSLGVWL
jgi:hypothetical protein